MCAALACYNWIAYDQKGVDMVCASECLIVNLNYTQTVSSLQKSGVVDISCTNCSEPFIVVIIYKLQRARYCITTYQLQRKTVK